MREGILLDLHGTLLDSNRAWIEAFKEIKPENAAYYEKQIWQKKSRHDLAIHAGVPFETLLEHYKKALKPREDVLKLVKNLSTEYPLALLSNSSRQRVVDDLRHLPNLGLVKIFTGEDGKKPNIEYCERVLGILGWDRALLIGNDPEEDMISSSRITCILIPYAERVTFFSENLTSYRSQK
jgi:HAD superfamily hydrolase (TIGR01549 family)